MKLGLVSFQTHQKKHKVGESKRERRRQVQRGGDFVSSNGGQKRAERERGRERETVPEEAETREAERKRDGGGKSKPRERDAGGH